MCDIFNHYKWDSFRRKPQSCGFFEDSVGDTFDRNGGLSRAQLSTNSIGLLWGQRDLNVLIDIYIVAAQLASFALGFFMHSSWSHFTQVSQL